MQAVVASASEPVFRQLWNRLIRKNLSSLVNDPVANFVVASAFGKVNEKGLEDVMPLPSTTWSECIGASSRPSQPCFEIIVLNDIYPTYREWEDGSDPSVNQAERRASLA